MKNKTKNLNNKIKLEKNSKYKIYYILRSNVTKFQS